ncbi:DUF4268 domain-containing protein [Flammeovirga sp. SJP92]|uniref:DUF4268 domain-containing protein n=1 Tax=Flammeovirga sp. SJP92 TaxID=1775430 RepID=UPI000786C613|nr:DUF4268 domain-containing protein [Flammeovirga sp. SJP92]KXX68119.1 hypothetical protein AVL50_23310 [Flammeovirga sp. SJP92]
MYSREEHIKMRTEFWTRFGQMMKPFTNSEGQKVNWVNYKTGIKNVFFKMDANKQKCSIGIYVTHRDLDLQEVYFQQFIDLKDFLHSVLEEEWAWEFKSKDRNNKTVSRIYIELEGVNLFKQDDQPTIYEFLKPRILKLNEFWEDAKEPFKALED